MVGHEAEAEEADPRVGQIVPQESQVGEAVQVGGRQMRSRHSRGDEALSILQYRTFVDSLLTALPEVKSQYDALQQKIRLDESPHMVVALVLESFAKDALKAKTNEALLRKVFAFLEEMASSQDIEVVNLLYVGIFEAWVAEPETLGRAWKYMGESTKQIASDAARRLNRGDNLPRVSRQ
jgi:hypothetical protein